MGHAGHTNFLMIGYKEGKTMMGVCGLHTDTDIHTSVFHSNAVVVTEQLPTEMLVIPPCKHRTFKSNC